MRQGWVYFVRFGPLVKIGITWDVEKRFRSLQASCPVPLHIHALMPGYAHEEATLHFHFKSARRHGEWFEGTPEMETLMDEIRTIYGPPDTDTFLPAFYGHLLIADILDREDADRHVGNLRRERDALAREVIRSDAKGVPVPYSVLLRLWRTQALLSDSGPVWSEEAVEQGKHRNAR